MATRLLLARVGAGKTGAVQRDLYDLKQRDPLARVWVLLSTERQIADFRRRFMADRPVYFNVETFNFYSLYRRLLAAAGNPQRCLDDAARYGLIRVLLADRYASGAGIFAGIAHTPGFVSIAAAFLFELKQNLMIPKTSHKPHRPTRSANSRRFTTATKRCCKSINWLTAKARVGWRSKRSKCSLSWRRASIC